MAATHQFLESNAVGEDETIPIANVNFGSNDSADLNTTTYPITRGENSFDKYIACKFTGTWTDITNMLFWKSAGAYVTGEDIHAEANASYATPSASDMGGSTIPTVEGSALAIQSQEGENHIEYGGSGVSGYTAYIRLQLQTTGSTPAGAVNQKTLTFRYDEV